MKDTGYFHGDMHLRNILIDDKNKNWLIDLSSIVKGYSSFYERIKLDYEDEWVRFNWKYTIYSRNLIKQDVCIYLLIIVFIVFIIQCSKGQKWK